jgi:hypothetical protein
MATKSVEAMLKHRVLHSTCGDTEDTKSLFDTACVASEDYYHDRPVTIMNIRCDKEHEIAV